ncbi:MAG: hypothetical protein V1779_11180 [bacterium]
MKLKKIYITLILLFILISSNCYSQNVDNSVKLKAMLNNPELMLSDQTHNVDESMKAGFAAFFKVEYENGYDIISDDWYLTELDSQLHVQMFKVKSKKTNRKFSFIFERSGNFKNFIPKGNFNPNDLSNNFKLVSHIINFPDSLEFYSEQDLNDSEFKNYLIKTIKEFKNNYYFYYFNYGYDLYTEKVIDNDIEIQAKNSNKNLTFLFIIKENKWRLKKVFEAGYP